MIRSFSIAMAVIALAFSADFAQAGGKEPARLPEALRAAKAFAGARIGE